MSVPLPLRQLAAVTGFELRRRIIGWKFPASIIVCLVIFYFAGTAGDEDDVYKLCKPMMASLPMVVAMSAVISASDSISEEFERNTGFALLSKPMYRETVFAGKYIACLICSFAIATLYCVLVAARCSEAGFEMPDTAVDTIPLAVLYAMAATGICLLFSALSPKSGIAMLAAFAVLIIIPLFVGNMDFETEPWYSLAYESEIFGH
ncbi:MAG: ABC transporter permease [Candidatus Methanomethylophilus sp.]|jgi:ABC-type Na+ efflux pump permease subunit|nr:ABC transporter permease [Methanomethylophilus sp.]MCI2075615.1 ABC transporter permease [Methanomethylophilus sp.]MCI2092724.1 ABC transporter permease [Methanomethylophilus sp.]